ncbi:Bro-N domain-containing protein [Streptomyces hygroscopicus]|uniref:BRO-N domain-containing protein n=1 Tax=Streptomyces hygroscopicus TaxID=1912 RepID=UPI00382A6C3E
MSIDRFANGEFNIELIPAGDSFRVAAPGLARGLGHRDAFNLLASVPEAEKGSCLVSTPGGDQQVRYVTEPGFYRCIGQRQAGRIKDVSIRDQVERFQRWVFHDVLPTLRKHGRYEVPGTSQVHGSLPSTLTWDTASAIGRAHHGLGMNTAEFRRMLVAAGVLRANKQPRSPYEDLFWPTDTRWEVHAHAVQYLVGMALVTARRMQEAARNVQMRLELDNGTPELPEGGAA